MEGGKSALATLNNVAKVEALLSAARRTRTVDAVDNVLAKAKELKVDGDVLLEAQELKTAVEKEESLTGKIATALANKEDAEVKDLVEELDSMQRDRSKSQQLTNAVLREARVLVDREGMMQGTRQLIAPP